MKEQKNYQNKRKANHSEEIIILDQEHEAEKRDLLQGILCDLPFLRNMQQGNRLNTGERKKMGKYVVIDFEMCPVAPEKRRYFRCRNEIIQIGAALLNEDLEIVDTFSCYVRPRFGKLDAFIQGLTGIRWADLKDAPCLKDALRQFLDSTEIQDSTFHRFCKEKLIIYYYTDFAIKNACRMFIYNTT